MSKIILLVSKFHETNTMIKNASEIIKTHGGVLHLIYVIKMQMGVSIDAEVVVEEGENYLDRQPKQQNYLGIALKPNFYKLEI